MARLEIEIGIGGISNVNKGITDVNGALSRLQRQYDSTMKEVAKASHTSRELEGELLRLNNAYRSGSISEREFNRETKSVQSALSSARLALGQYQAQAKSLSATINQSTLSVANQGREVKKLEGYHKSFNSGIRSTNTLAVEFSRIVQDLPYGMQGVGNNIQQLTQNWAYYAQSARQAAAANGQSISTWGLIRGAMSSMLSPLNLLTLGVSAVTAGWVLYEKWAQKSAKATKEAEKATTSYIETLEGVSRAQADGQSNALKELTSIEQLYKATQNVNIPMEDRVGYAKELIKQGGKLFESTTEESIVAGKASEAYDKLTNSIRQTAMAQAYMQKMTDNATTALNNNLKILNEANEIQKINQQIQQARQNLSTTAAGAGVGASSAAEYNTIARLEQKRADRIKEITSLNKANSEVLKEQDMLQKGINNSLENGGSLIKSSGGGAEKIRDTTKELMSLTDSIVKESLSFYDAKLFDINKKYDEIYSKIKDSDTLGLARINEQAERTRLSIDRWSDGLDKFSKKARGINLSGVISTDIPDIPRSEIDRINKPIISNLGKIDDKLSGKLSRVVERGFRQGLDSIFGEIDDLGSNFYQVFTNVFGKLSGSVTKILTNVISTQLGNAISKSWDSDALQIGGLKSGVSKAIIAGAGIAGQAMGSMFRATSQAGQGAAGGLSGAASGFAVGSAISKSGGIWGAAIGGLIGIFSGIFGAKERKRQLKLQEQALEEQRKQTAFQQRMAALTFTSSIVGQQTNSGIVTSVDRNEFGDVTFRVEGRDLVATMSREQEAQKRGL